VRQKDQDRVVTRVGLPPAAIRAGPSHCPHTAATPQGIGLLCEATAGSYEIGVEWLRSLRDERELPMPAEHLVRVIHVLNEGLVLQRILTPELCPNEVFFAAFAALADHRRDANLDAH
jgi:hypothetical protein